jgi:hypothetical protein
MPRYSDYRCTRCGRICSRELLIAKSVVFSKLGAGGRVIQSRTKEWLDDDCLKKDEDWNLPPFKSPGMVSPGKARVEELKSRGKKDA